MKAYGKNNLLEETGWKSFAAELYRSLPKHLQSKLKRGIAMNTGPLTCFEEYARVWLSHREGSPKLFLPAQLHKALCRIAVANDAVPLIRVGK